MFSRKKKTSFSMILAFCVLISVIASPVFGADKWVFKHATYAPTTHVYTRVFEEFGERLSDATDGKVEVKVYPNAALCKGADQFTSTAMGSIEMTELMADYMVGQVDMLGVTTLPFTYDPRKGDQLSEEAREIITERLAKEDLVFLFGFGNGGNGLFLKDTSKTSLSALQGTKVRASGVYAIDIIKAVGLVPVRMSTGDIYMAVETGLIDGASTSVLTWAANTCYEVLPIIVKMKVQPSTSFVAINKTIFNGLPENIQSIIMDEAKKFAPVANQMVVDQEEALLKKAVEEWGCTIVEPSEEDLEQWRSAAKDIREKAIKTGGAEAEAMWTIMQKYPETK